MSAQLSTNQSLSKVNVGSTVVIESINPTMDDSIKNRLLVLGFVPGSIVYIVRRAPFGDPTEYEIRGSRISLRRSESSLIQVTPFS